MGVIGQISMFGGNDPPSKWLLCDGSAVSRSTYSDLFGVIGTTYGVGDGSTTFNLPDMRSRSPIGKGQGAGLSLRVLGTTTGEENHILTVPEMPSHSHTINRGSVGYGTSACVGSDNVQGTNGTSASGSDTSHNTVHPVLVISFIICYEGDEGGTGGEGDLTELVDVLKRALLKNADEEEEFPLMEMLGNQPLEVIISKDDEYFNFQDFSYSDRQIG